MYYSSECSSPVGRILIAADENNIVGLWIEGQEYGIEGFDGTPVPKDDHPLLMKAKAWIESYFAGKQPSADELPLDPKGGEFRQHVWRILREIPYGQTTTYGAIAKEVAKRTGKEKMSAQAVGGAVGSNPVSIIIPCHRVIGAGGKLTGYAGGIDIKVKLLRHEGNRDFKED